METISDVALCANFRQRFLAGNRGRLADHKRLYHLGMAVVPKSTLSKAMNRHSPELFRKLFEELLDRTMEYAPYHKFKFNTPGQQ